MDPNSLKVTELKSELTARGLSSKGLKKELVTRLEEALASEGTSTADNKLAPKSNQPMDTNEDEDEDDKDNIEEEAKEIAKVVEPVQEPKAAVAEFDVIMAAVPEPADSSSSISSSGDIVSAATTTVLEPVVGTPTLSQEGLVDTTVTSSTSTTHTDSNKKRQLETEEIASSDRTETVKRLRQGSEEHAKIRAVAAVAVETDTLRRSAAPSPSPAPRRSGSTASISTIASSSLTPGPPSPTEGRNKTGAIRFDARSIMERQIQMAVQDRKPDGSSSSTSVAESKPLATVNEGKKRTRVHCFATV